MAAQTYDIITVGGGIAGSILAGAKAEHGAKVLVLESATSFRDRVRGEAMGPWSTKEAMDLGVYDTLMAAGANLLQYWNEYHGPEVMDRRDFVATTVPQMPMLAIYHPDLQEALINAASDAGAEVRRGARVSEINLEGAPTVKANLDGQSTEFQARLVVSADGRSSMGRASGGFSVQVDPDLNMVAGVLLDGLSLQDDGVHHWMNPSAGHKSFVFCQRGGRGRAYVSYPASTEYRLSGASGFSQFLAGARVAGVPDEIFGSAAVSGPLATFSGATNWVEHPYRNGLALIGDAAGATDPSWGQGLGLAIHDAKLLSENLMANEDWEKAGNAYAVQHDRDFGIIHTFENWMAEVLCQTGPEADTRRERILPMWHQDPSRNPLTIVNGPSEPLDETVRRRFFCED